MAYISVEDLPRHTGETVSVRGWLYHKRSSGKIRFLVVRDGTGILQCVMAKNAVSDDVFGLFDKLTQESSVIVTGLIQMDARAPRGCEMDLSMIEPVHIAQEYPITTKKQSMDFLIDNRNRCLRTHSRPPITR